MNCEICGASDHDCKIRKIHGMWLCSKHITQLYRHGDFLKKTIYDPNEYIVYDDYAEIILMDKYQNEVGRALIDIEDIEKCKQYKWHLRKSLNTNYVIATLDKTKKVHLHRLILNYDGRNDVDHINHNGLDNRKQNLRIVSHSDNARNQHGMRKGIKLVGSGRYQALITVGGHGEYLGTFDTYEDALAARTKAEANI